MIANHFDLVITDIEMPLMRGTELLEKIKTLNVQTSVIIITAFGSLRYSNNCIKKWCK
jgi:YesN/AraC family two-component response regulator